jgi:hypothetical protein
LTRKFNGKEKVFSAEALLEGLRAIQEETTKTGSLNLAYLPILQQILPGEIQDAQNALNFARSLVTDWLTKYKFKPWKKHSSTGLEVSDDERRARADEVAQQLADHSRWLTHGRSIKMTDLEAMRLKITDYSKHSELMEAIRRYHTLLQMLFESNCCKVIETSSSQIYRFAALPTQASPIPQGGVQGLPVPAAGVGGVAAGFRCPHCNHELQIQAKFDPNMPDNPDAIRWPVGDKLKCPSCGVEHDLGDMRRQLEAQVGRPVVG